MKIRSFQKLRLNQILLLLLLVGGLTGCEPEVGSPEWCEKMDKKEKGDWTANETGDYLKHCVLKRKSK